MNETNHGGNCTPEACPHESGILEMRTSIKEITRDVHAIKVALIGKVDGDKPAAFERLRRLEETDRSRRKWTAVVLTTWLGLAAAWAWDLLRSSR